jgi:serine/threonine-protein kinase
MMARMERESPPGDKQFVGAGLDTGGGRPFVQQRLALLGKTVFGLAFGFFVVINGLLIAGGAPAVPLLTRRYNILHFLAAWVMGGVWAIARGRPRSLRTLGALDAGSLLLAGIGLAAMAAQADDKQLTNGLLALTVTMMARAVLIPSTPGRTACLSSLASVPLLVVSYVFHGPPAVPGGFAPGFLRFMVLVDALLWLTIAVVLSVVASRTIYGLRKQVRDASDIGQYTLEAKIGHGGMGEVWRRATGCSSVPRR